MSEKIKQVTIKSQYLLVGGALMDIGKVWSGTLSERFIELQFIGGGTLSFLRNDGGEYIGDVETTHVELKLFDQMRDYLLVNLKPIKIIK